MNAPLPTFTHLRRLTDDGGLYEHALGAVARPEHGYCTDDVARALVVVCREPEPPVGLRGQYLAFVLAALAEDGRCHNRRGTDGRWQDEACVEDCWGRALWGLGAAVAGCSGTERERALAGFELGARNRSPWPRATAFAALGAAEVLDALPGHRGATALLADAVRVVRGAGVPTPGWGWPEPRLTYANAVVPETLLAAGAALEDPALVAEGLRLLGWLLDHQSLDGHLSVVPVGGWGPTDLPPGFDQQPIEVAALAEACARAYRLTGEQRWARGIEQAVAWFLGANDVGTPLLDADSGGGCDGLEPHGRNDNQGAESTLALLSTLQQARLLPASP